MSQEINRIRELEDEIISLRRRINELETDKNLPSGARAEQPVDVTPIDQADVTLRRLVQRIAMILQAEKILIMFQVFHHLLELKMKNYRPSKFVQLMEFLGKFFEMANPLSITILKVKPKQRKKHTDCSAFRTECVFLWSLKSVMKRIV